MKRYLFLLLVLGISCQVFAFKAFKISDIRIEGLQRISAGTVFTYLPVKVGQRFTQKKSARTVRALYKTGFFKDVQLQHEGNVLVIEVVERPSLASVKVIGNKGIDDDILKQSFKKLGFLEGRVFNKSLLDKIEQELRRIYFSEGKYGVKIKSIVTPQPRNRVGVEITISEGRSAKIRKINLVGTAKFKTKKLLKLFVLRTPGALTFYSKKDQYSKQKLGGDLEKLRSFYHDNGYSEFRISSTQVSISPDKKDIYITINVHEGPQYRVRSIKLAGRFDMTKAEINAMVSFTKGSIYSRKEVTSSRKKIKEHLANNGYANAQIKAIPSLNKKKNTVGITLFIDPGRRVYVRRILMVGNLRTGDLVLRRELRQMEGTWYNAKKVQRSKVRLQKLGFFTSVDVKKKAVVGSNDQIDIIFKVKEKPGGNFLASIGYSETSGVILQTSVTQDNFLGTGRKIAVSLNTSDINQGYKISYVNPYYTKDGVSRGFTFRSEETDATQANLSNYETDETSFHVNYGIPLSEFNRLRFSVGYKKLDLITTGNSPTEVLDFSNLHGVENETIVVSVGWSHDTRNKAIFADKGVLHRISVEVAVPGGDLEYYKVRYKHQRFIKLSKRLTLSLKGNVAYGEATGDTASLPFYENFFAGGVKSIRGYKDNTLGPRDSNNNPIGGALKVVGSFELIFPPPFNKDSKSFRLSAFMDFGNVFADADTYDEKEIRASAGLSMIWISPIGPLSLSVAAPIEEKTGDKTEVVQFSLGGSFF